MPRTFIILLIAFLAPAFAQNTPSVTITSAANSSIGIAPESLATATGMSFSMQSAKAAATPWPTSLGGVTVQVTDSASMSRPAGLLFVSPTLINFQIPAGTAPGQALVRIDNGVTQTSGTVQIQPVAPALFVINDLNIAAATAIRVIIPTHSQAPVIVFQCFDIPGSCRLVPIDPGVDAPVYLSFYGTGISGRSSLANVTVTIGSVSIPALYAGPQGQFPGLDQVNVPLPLSLRGAGVVNLTVAVDGVASNPVQIQVM
ncbi:MAG TPA: hypothetical protein VH157_16650 [Bryobacteraceae bacterium]|jgi:uncharacterized protein (TIGR03437 family)|nr:hypothetical protein [Bryobacteraceae bacterium]